MPDDDQLFHVPELDIDLVEVEMAASGESGQWNSGQAVGWPRIAGLLSEIGTDIGDDYRNFYSYRNLPGFVALIGLGAYMANTHVDQNILEHVQDNVTFHKNDEYQEFVEQYRFFGEGQFLLPFYASTALVGKHLLSDYEAAFRIGQWADRSLRGVFVGAPPLLLTQYIIGASRPGETGEGSEWQFFADSNGVSGHAFMGAIPFITAAEMTDGPFAKSFLYVVSAFPALSRVTENDHYPSQAILGWSLAYFACRSVSRTEAGPGGIQVQPWISHSGVGLGLSFRR